eukprot:Ihof_evm2s447 gene=Ihof_evmTU2s447
MNALKKAANGGLDKKVKAKNSKDLMMNADEDDVTVPLHIAVTQGVSCVACIINRQNVDPNVRDPDGNTPLMVAAKHGQSSVVSYLSNYSHVELDHKNNMGETALHIAVQMKSVGMVEQLTRMGADKNITDNQLKTPTELILDMEDRAMQSGLMHALNVPVSMQGRLMTRDRRMSKQHEKRKSLFRSDSSETVAALIQQSQIDKKKRKKRRDDGDNMSIKSSFSIFSRKPKNDYDTQSCCSRRSEWDGTSVNSFDPTKKEKVIKKGLINLVHAMKDKLNIKGREHSIENLSFGADFDNSEDPIRSVSPTPRRGLAMAVQRSSSLRSKLAQNEETRGIRLQIIYGTRHMVLTCESNTTVEQLIKEVQKVAE